jgi:hypothetical protein
MDCGFQALNAALAISQKLNACRLSLFKDSFDVVSV